MLIKSFSQPPATETKEVVPANRIPQQDLKLLFCKNKPLETICLKCDKKHYLEFKMHVFL